MSTDPSYNIPLEPVPKFILNAKSYEPYAEPRKTSIQYAISSATARKHLEHYPMMEEVPVTSTISHSTANA